MKYLRYPEIPAPDGVLLQEALLRVRVRSYIVQGHHLYPLSLAVLPFLDHGCHNKMKQINQTA